MSPALAGRFLTTAPPGKSLPVCFFKVSWKVSLSRLLRLSYIMKCNPGSNIPSPLPYSIDSKQVIDLIHTHGERIIQGHGSLGVTLGCIHHILQRPCKRQELLFLVLECSHGRGSYSTCGSAASWLLQLGGFSSAGLCRGSGCFSRARLLQHQQLPWHQLLQYTAVSSTHRPATSPGTDMPSNE